MKKQKTMSNALGKSSINLRSLLKTTSRGKKRVGRGYGSGKGGHTSGRGQKGQRSRRTIPWGFEGGQLPLIKRVSFWRGKGRLNPLKPKPVIIKIAQFSKLKSGTNVTIDTLIQERLVSAAEIKSRGVKILAGGKITQKLTVVGLKMSIGARKAVEEAGGKVETKERLASPKAERSRRNPSRNSKVTKKRVVLSKTSKPRKIK